jgi:hypothetical protein
MLAAAAHVADCRLPARWDHLEDYLEANNGNPKPFVWTATAEQILANVARGRVTLQQA